MRSNSLLRIFIDSCQIIYIPVTKLAIAKHVDVAHSNRLAWIYVSFQLFSSNALFVLPKDTFKIGVQLYKHDQNIKKPK